MLMRQPKLVERTVCVILSCWAQILSTWNKGTASASNYCEIVVLHSLISQYNSSDCSNGSNGDAGGDMKEATTADQRHKCDELLLFKARIVKLYTWSEFITRHFRLISACFSLHMCTCSKTDANHSIRPLMLFSCGEGRGRHSGAAV